MSVQTEINKFVKEKIREGWREEYGKHRKLYHPKGCFISMSISPSCVHALKNIKRDAEKLERSHREKVAT